MGCRPGKGLFLVAVYSLEAYMSYPRKDVSGCTFDLGCL